MTFEPAPPSAPLRQGTPFRRKLLQLTVAGLVPLVVFTALSILSSIRSQREDLARATLDLARAVASAVDAELFASVSLLEGLSASNEIVRGDLRALHREWQEITRVRPDINGLSLAAPDGRVLLRTSVPFGSPTGPPVEPSSLARVLESRAPEVGGLARGSSGRYAYAVRVPVFRGGELRYVLTASVTPVLVQGIVNQQRQPQDWVISVFDSNLRRVARSRDHQRTLGGEPAPSLRALLQESGGREGTGMTRALEGDEIVTAHVPIPRAGWVVAIGAPVRLASPDPATVLLFVLGVGASLLAALLFAATLARRLSRDVDALVTQAAGVGLGAPPEPELGTAELAAISQAVVQADERVRSALVRAEMAAVAKDQFLAVLGHELRNPLAPIVNVLNLLDMKSGDATAREREILRRQVAHMTRLVDDLLDVSRLVQGKVELKLEPVDLRESVREAVDGFSRQASGATVDLRLPDDPLFVRADRTRLVQVLSNLLLNAERHGGGQPIRVELAAREERALIVVTDKGEGMDEVTLSHVFEPFFQARSTSGSLGLGLAIVKSLVERHGGSVSARSEGPGTGSTFVVSLPAATAQQG